MCDYYLYCNVQSRSLRDSYAGISAGLNLLSNSSVTALL